MHTPLGTKLTGQKGNFRLETENVEQTLTNMEFDVIVHGAHEIKEEKKVCTYILILNLSPGDNFVWQGKGRQI